MKTYGELGLTIFDPLDIEGKRGNVSDIHTQMHNSNTWWCPNVFGPQCMTQWHSNCHHCFFCLTGSKNLRVILSIFALFRKCHSVNVKHVNPFLYPTHPSTHSPARPTLWKFSLSWLQLPVLRSTQNLNLELHTISLSQRLSQINWITHYLLTEAKESIEMTYKSMNTLMILVWVSSGGSDPHTRTVCVRTAVTPLWCRVNPKSGAWLGLWI